jgi:hypothetical protein
MKHLNNSVECKNYSSNVESPKSLTSRRNSITKYLLFIILFAVSTSAIGQVYKLRTTEFASKYQINNYRWSEWTEWKDASILIVINLKKERITIYSKETQIYDIIEDEGQKTDSEGNKTYSLFCVNADGVTCRVRLRAPAKNGRMQLYVDFKDMMWVYNVYFVD